MEVTWTVTMMRFHLREQQKLGVSSSLVIISCLFSVRAIYSLAWVKLKSLAKLCIRAWFPRPFYERAVTLRSLSDCVLDGEDTSYDRSELWNVARQDKLTVIADPSVWSRDKEVGDVGVCSTVGVKSRRDASWSCAVTETGVWTVVHAVLAELCIYVGRIGVHLELWVLCVAFNSVYLWIWCLMKSVFLWLLFKSDIDSMYCD